MVNLVFENRRLVLPRRLTSDSQTGCAFRNDVYVVIDACGNFETAHRCCCHGDASANTGCCRREMETERLPPATVVALVSDAGAGYLSMASSSTSSHPAKRKKLQKYRREWETDHHWLVRVGENLFKANCTLSPRAFYYPWWGL
ncbi:hypothetical protein LSAT2_007877 [Lamellibrachia satsuma]|nr:hypothetical protein LSAT2_007877 [Lamellibrachia satsuma]